MEHPPIKRKRNFGEMLSDTIRIPLAHYRPMLLAVIMYAGPLFLLQGILTGMMQDGMWESMAELTSGGIQSPEDILELYANILGWEFFASILTSFFAYAMLFSIVYGYLLTYAETQVVPSLEELRDMAFKNYGLMLGTIFGVFAFILVISLLTIVPVGILVGFLGQASVVAGVLLGILLFLGVLVLLFYLIVGLVPIYIIRLKEGLGLADSIRRSFQLIRPAYWQTLGLVLVVSLLIGVVGFVFSIPSSIISVMRGFMDSDSTGLFLSILGGIIAAVGAGVLRSFMATAITLQYFNLTETQEGHQDNTLIDEIGKDE